MANLMSLTKDAKALGILAIVVAIVLAILQQFQTGGLVTGTANTSIGTFITAIATIADWAGIIVLAIVGFFLLVFISKKNK